MWAPQKYKDMVTEGQGMKIDKDIVADEDVSLLAEISRLRKRFDDTINTWTTKPDVKSRRALLVVALCIGDESMWNKSNEILITQLLVLLYGDICRAHPDGVVVYRNGEINYHGRAKKAGCGAAISMH